jgi:hypothetical protein
MNADIHLEHRAGSSQGKHEGEPSLGLCDRLDRTRDNSQRQLPTDHDYAVSTREYQTDQSSLKTAPTAARSVFGKRNANHQNEPTDLAQLTRSLHIRPYRLSSASLGLPHGLVTKNAVAVRQKASNEKLSEIMRRSIPLPAPAADVIGWVE